MASAAAEVIADMQLLLECLKCQLDNPTSLREALKTIALMCINTESAKDHLRESGGLDFIVELLITSGYPEVQNAAMYALGCAVERNVPSQTFLTTPAMFTFLNKILVSDNATVVQKQTACFLIICLVANNGNGQVMVRKSNCLDTLMHLFKKVLPQQQSSGDGWLDGLEGKNLTLWSTVNSAICICVNNPQNDQNQRMCASLLPHAFKFMQENSDRIEVLRPLASLIGLTVSSNVHNQERVSKCGGIEVLAVLLQHAINRTVHSRDEGSSSDPLQTAICVTNTIDAIITNNENNAAECVHHEVLASLLKLLEINSLSTEFTIQVVVTIGHCADSSVAGQLQLVENGGLSTLIKCLAHTSDEELSSAIKYVLQSCVSIDQRALTIRTTPQRQQMKPILSIAKRELYQNKYGLQVMPALKENINTAASENQKSMHDHLAKVKSTESSLIERDNDIEFRNKGDQEICNKLDELEKKLEKSLSGQKQILEEMEQSKVVTPSPSLSHLSPPSQSAPPIVSEEDHHRLQQQLENTKQALEKATKEKEDVERTMAVTLEIENQHSAMQMTEVGTEEDEDQEENEEEEEGEDDFDKAENISQHSADNAEIVTPREITKQLAAKHVQSGMNSAPRNVKIVRREEMVNQNRTPSKVQKSKTPTTRSCGVQTPDTPGIANLIQQGSQEFMSSNPADTGCHCHEKSPAANQTELDIVELAPCHIDGKSLKTPEEPVFVRPLVPPARTRTVRQEKRESVQARNCQRGGGRNTPIMSSHRLSKVINTNRTPTTRVQVTQLQHEPGMCGDGSQRTPRPITRKQLPVCPPSPASSATSQFDADLMHYARDPLTSQQVVTDNYKSRNTGKVEHWLNTQHTFVVPSTGEGEKGRTSPNTQSDDEVSMCSEAIMSEIESIETDDSKARQRAGNSMCPGCQPRAVIHGALLNSRTYNIGLETSNFTCAVHRFIREKERQCMAQLRKSRIHQGKQRPPRYLKEVNSNEKCTSSKCRDVYDFVSSEESDSHGQKPDIGLSGGSVRSVSTSQTAPAHNGGSWRKQRRRNRVPYTEQEITNIKDGVNKIGKFWNQIIWTYQFHPSRTAVDLKDKYKRLMLKEDSSSVAPSVKSHRSRIRQPFAMVEERRLRRGVRKFGYNWKLILASYKFAEGRTKEHLRDKWRNSHRKSVS